MNYNELPPDQLVDLLADKTLRNQAIIALVGGITSTELRRVNVSDAAHQALIDGLKHPNSKVRWWCIQLMDHIADERYLLPLLTAAHTDPTPKNRRHAIHAMTCEICKPNRQPLRLDADILAEIATIARLDSDLSVRTTALHELEERSTKS
ncbi:MAG: HEAT repeat domain-containing protein [Chloroflexota bacterium]